ncbi:spore germination protein KC [Caminicella sporogenes DSM 14501]|uniref:Spore germination protein KC n=1 Tax=Caminicella sporogenes DSM 14501 TaxID=1121266 RepID=A0A1M6NN16_9FIRM|nr:Ger(x)C family spore germination protein [Caminicella sporogenes]RKD22145.1 hypothetical protein BET04_05835 [Caminicella sporogenes]SHJ97131.1 spore germination protein KC [Caminicella sporogenes DSM 14501]
MNKFYKLILLIIVNNLLLIGCWNYKDINKMRFVAGIAVDYDKSKDEYIITAEIASPQGSSTQIKREIFQSRGETAFDGVRDLIFKNGRKLFWAHTKVIILGKSVVNKKLLSVLDYISRDAEFKDDIWLLVSKEESASKIYEIDYKKPQEIISFNLDNVFKNSNRICTYYAVPLWRFMEILQSEGASPTLPGVKIVEKEGKVFTQVEEIAVFKKDRIVGWLNTIESRSFLFLIDEIKGGVITVDCDTSRGIVKVGLEVLDNNTKIKPVRSGNNLVVNIDIKLIVSIGEIGGDIDVISNKGREKLKEDTENLIKKQVEDLIKKVQNQYKSDIFEFSKVINKKMPSVWKDIKPNWEEIFSNIKTKVNVKVTIKSSALTSRPIKVNY